MDRQEEWRPIRGFEGLYEISNHGRVKSIPRLTGYAAGRGHENRGRFLVPVRACKDPRCNYFRVTLSKDNCAQQVSIHRLVADHFVEKRDGCNVVNHIDGNKHNNRADNLEWTTPRGNKIHAVYTGIDTPPFGIKKVYCVSNNAVYPSASQAERELGLSEGAVAKACRGVQKTAGGMRFAYV